MNEKNNKLRIGIDIDEVITEFVKPFFEFCKEKNIRTPNFEDVNCFDLENIMDLSREEVHSLFGEFNDSEERVKRGGFIDFSKEGINELAKNSELFIITARMEKIINPTKDFFKEHFPGIHLEIAHSGDTFGKKKNKVEICSELGVDFFIEDRRKTALECAEAGVKVFLMDKPWNRENCEHENIIRVKGWKEILEKINEGKIKQEVDYVEEVRKFVEEECRKNPTGQGYDPYIYHFVPVRNHAIKLAKEKEADVEIVEIAAWLHDVGSIVDGRENHHITGVKIAEEKLNELNYPKDKIELIKKCILNHRGSMDNSRESVEEQIIAEADSIACFDNIAGIFQAAYCWEGHSSRASAEKAVRDKLLRKWNQLSLEGKEMVRNKYEAAMLLLGD